MKARDTVRILIGVYTYCIADVLEVDNFDDDDGLPCVSVRVDVRSKSYPHGVWYDISEVKLLKVFRALSVG